MGGWTDGRRDVCRDVVVVTTPYKLTASAEEMQKWLSNRQGGSGFGFWW